MYTASDEIVVARHSNYCWHI